MKTPQLPAPKLSAALGLTAEVWLKREDRHKYGSHKGRSIPLMIAQYHQAGWNDFVISSSGNAALTALIYVFAHNRNQPHDPLTLKILVGEKIAPKKLQRLTAALSDARQSPSGESITLEQGPRPKQTAWQIDKRGQAKLLRQSTDPLALVGYGELAAELSKVPNLAAVFVPTSSGTTAEGLHVGFKNLGLNPQIHIVQTDACHPLVPRAAGEKAGPPCEPSLASAIIDRVAHRKTQVLEALKTSRGEGWIATNTEIVQAQKLVKETTGLEISPTSALSVVGWRQAIAAGWRWSGPVMCLLTGP